MPRPRSPIQAVRQRILEAAFAAFLEKGYAGATTREIAARAKVSKRDLYALFQDKQAMLAACIKITAQRARQPLELEPARDRRALQSALEDRRRRLEEAPRAIDLIEARLLRALPFPERLWLLKEARSRTSALGGLASARARVLARRFHRAVALRNKLALPSFW